MACATKVGGVAFLRVDGFQYLLRGDLTVNPGGFTREGIVGQDGFHGYTETPVTAEISATLTDTGGLSLTQLRNITCSTVTVELANGKMYVLRDAFVTEAFELNTAEGSLAVTFVGAACEELLAA